MYFVTQLTRTRKRTLTKLHIFKPQNFEPTHPTFCMKRHNTHVCISHITAENLVYICNIKWKEGMKGPGENKCRHGYDMLSTY